MNSSIDPLQTLSEHSNLSVSGVFTDPKAQQARPLDGNITDSEGATKSATVVVLLHGLCSSAQELLPVDEAIKAVGYETCSLIIPGYSFEMNRSKQKARSYTDWIDYVEHEALELKKRYAKVVLVGISAGANLVLGAFVKNRDVAHAAVLMSTPLILDGWNIPFYHFLLPLALYTPLGWLWSYEEAWPFGLKNERIRAWVAKDLKARRLSSAGASVLEVSHLREHDKLQKHLLKSMSQASAPPTLVLHASEDDVASLENLRFIQMCWKTPIFRCHVLDNSYHMISWDNDRAEVCDKVIEFLDELHSTECPRLHSNY